MPTAMWRALVPVVALAAGLLFATSARVSHGTDLRGSSTANLVDLVRSAQAKATKMGNSARTLDAEVQRRTSVVAASDNGVAAAQRRSTSLEDPAGLVAERGPGLFIVLDDSPRTPDPAIDANNYVIHQSDLQAVVNALWAGGAEAMSIAGQRVIATSAVRCVGSTLLLNGQVYSPPFRIEAIGAGDPMRSALDRSYGVSLIRQAVDALGLRFSVESSGELHIPAFDGTIGLTYATVP